MIDRYIFKGDQLFLFLNYNYEFSLDNKDKISFKKIIKDFINNHKIDFSSGRIILVVGGIVLASFFYLDNKITLSNLNNNEKIIYTETFKAMTSKPKTAKKTNTQTKKVNTSKLKNKKTTVKKKTNLKNKANTKKISKKKTTTKKISKNKTVTNNKQEIKVTIYRSNGKIIKLNLEEYIIGVVAGEMPASFNLEALKAQAILARTYALKSIKNNKKLTDTVSTQVYIDTNQMKSKWGSDYSKYYNKIKCAVDSTKGYYITYKGNLIDAVYHAISNGYTEDSIAVWGHSISYLKSVDSKWDKNVSGYKKTITISSSKVLSVFGINDLSNIEIISRNSSGRVNNVKVGSDTYSGVDIRTLLGLRSTDFDIDILNGNLVITTRGYGHGVGLSQYGANGMAKEGYSYDKILKHYYSGITINK